MKRPGPCRPSKAVPRVHVLLVDDHPAVRQGLTLLLAAEDIVVRGEAGGRAEALARIIDARPDLAIVDLSLDGDDGLSVLADLHRRGVPVLIYSMHDDPRHVQDAVAGGALGYVTKREFQDVLVHAIREVAAGRRFLSPRAAAALAESVTATTAPGLEKLSPHERQVYELLGQGVDTSDIATTLHVTTHTVESYYSRIIVKLNVQGMYELRRHAIARLRKHAT